MRQKENMTDLNTFFSNGINCKKTKIQIQR